MQILRHLPIQAQPSTVQVGDEIVPIRAYQIIVWMSLAPVPTVEAPVFPAVLDTGHSHNFSIRETQLRRWAGIRTDALRKLGAILVNQQEVPLHEACLWIYRNRPRTLEVLPRPFPLRILEGISVFPDGLPNAPRLPLLGLRGLMSNNLRLVLSRMTVSLSTARKET